MKKTLIIFLWLFNLTANAQLFIQTDRSDYITGQTIHFTVNLMNNQENHQSDLFKTKVDLVRPSGDVLRTLIINGQQIAPVKFELADTLSTGVYRIIANSKKLQPAIKRINVYSKDENFTTSTFQQAGRIQVRGLYGPLYYNLDNKMIVRVTDVKGKGISGTVSIFNDSDSLLNYIKTDINGFGSFDIKPESSAYVLKFQDKESHINVHHTPSSYLKFNTNGPELLLTVEGTVEDNAFIKILTNDHDVEKIRPSNTHNILKDVDLPPGVYQIQYVVDTDVRQKFTFIHESTENQSLEIQFTETDKEWLISTNQEGLDFAKLEIKVRESTQDENDFYQSVFFEQKPIDLIPQTISLPTDYLVFSDQLIKPTNEFQRSIAVDYCTKNPFHKVSFLSLNQFEAFEFDCDQYNINSFHNELDKFEKSKVYALYLDEKLKPVKPVNFDLKDTIPFPSINSNPIITDRILNMINDQKKKESILNTFSQRVPRVTEVDLVDFTYTMNDYRLPKTMIEVINQIVTYANCKKNGEEFDLRVLRYGSTYKFDNPPLILINGVPTYDERALLNLEPKSIKKIEIINSNSSTRPFKSLGINGIITVTLNDNIENPLENVYNQLPVLYHSNSLQSSLTKNGPDIRDLLYWKVFYNNNATINIELPSPGTDSDFVIEMIGLTKKGEIINSERVISRNKNSN